MNVREQRLNELLTARQRIDAQIAKFDATVRITALPAHDAMTDVAVWRIADMARHMVWDGHTHDETARALGIEAGQVAPLLEFARKAAA